VGRARRSLRLVCSFLILSLLVASNIQLSELAKWLRQILTPKPVCQSLDISVQVTACPTYIQIDGPIQVSFQSGYKLAAWLDSCTRQVCPIVRVDASPAWHAKVLRLKCTQVSEFNKECFLCRIGKEQRLVIGGHALSVFETDQFESMLAHIYLG
jgi:hypothetical protein